VEAQATIMREQFLDFAMFNESIFSHAAKKDLLGMAQRSPSEWWRNGVCEPKESAEIWKWTTTNS
jgi:hypothetical protein